MSIFKKFMAKRCDACPLCRFARNHPDTWLGRLMHWHGKWCPFWKAWEEIYGQTSSPNTQARDDPFD